MNLEEIKSDFYKKEIMRILKKIDANDKERYFLTSFLKDQIKLNKNQVCDIIAEHNSWEDYNPGRTFYLVSRIYEKKTQNNSCIELQQKPIEEFSRPEKIIEFATFEDYETYLAEQLENCLNRMEKVRLKFFSKIKGSQGETTPLIAGDFGVVSPYIEQKNQGGDKNS